MLFGSSQFFSLPCIGVTLLGCCVTVQASSVESAATQSTVLEIIIKFADDSDAGRRVHRVLEEHPADLSGLAPLQARLHRATGVALEPDRITSGAELIFRIPEEPLLEAVRQTVSRNAQVSSARLVTTPHDNPRLPRARLLLHFRATSETAGLLEKAFGEACLPGARASAGDAALQSQWYSGTGHRASAIRAVRHHRSPRLSTQAQRAIERTSVRRLRAAERDRPIHELTDEIDIKRSKDRAALPGRSAPWCPAPSPDFRARNRKPGGWRLPRNSF